MRMPLNGRRHHIGSALPWVLLGFSVLLGNSPSVDLMGIAVGHLYFFLDDVFPYTRGGRGRRPLRSPAWLLRLLEGEGLFGAPVQHGFQQPVMHANAMREAADGEPAAAAAGAE